MRIFPEIILDPKAVIGITEDAITGVGNCHSSSSKGQVFRGLPLIFSNRGLTTIQLVGRMFS